MLKYVLRRLAYSLILVVLASVFIFALTRARGDPRYMYLEDAYITQERWDAWGREMGLDKPIVVQYLIWASKAARGNFGESQVNRRDAWGLVGERLPATLQLSGVAYVLVVLVSVPLGVMAAVKRGTVVDLIGRTFALLGQATPTFWLGLMMILLFAVYLGWFPTSGRGGLASYVLPGITLASGSIAASLRLIRTSMLEVLDSEYIKFARAKGVSSNLVIWKHALRNSLLVPLTYFGLLFAAFMTGTVVVETIFAWPGVGRLAIEAVFNNDFPVVSAVVIFFVLVYAVTSLMVDLLYAVADPRIRYG
ncbi:MAG: ABC transporter permease [Dehalococcoidia bacterium]